MMAIFKGLRITLILALFGALVSGCSNNLLDGSDRDSAKATRAVVPNDKRTAKITVYMLNAPDKIAQYNVWAWIEHGDAYNTENWPGADMKMEKTDVDDRPAFMLTFKVKSDEGMGIIFVDNEQGDGSKTSDIFVSADMLKNDAKLYFVWGSTIVYESVDECIGIMSAQITSEDGRTLSVTVSLLDEIDKNKLAVKDSEGNSLAVSEVGEIENSKAEVKLSSGSLDNIPYTLTYNGGKEILATITSDIIEKRFAKAAVEKADDLGVTISGGKATFRTWAPIAESVEVLLYKTAVDAGVSPKEYKDTGATTTDLGTPNDDPIKMQCDFETGIWTAENVDFGSNKYYKYKIVNGGTTYYVCDIWAKAANADSYAAEIVDINSDSSAIPLDWESSYTNPFGKSGAEVKNYTDAVIYEMHIRDWSRAFKKNSTGKFEDITAALGANGSGEFAKHLKDLGVTHVQILPMFDYAQTVLNTDYNWGYNPYHYNVPEGRYVNYGDNKDGTNAVKQMRAMIKAFHDAGIAVIMDVVYNHTSGTKVGSLYDSTVPEYFYRINEDGSYSNGSGCGNEVATNHIMVRKYVIESLKHWMSDYHINGFRFDLMGLHEQSTMKEIYEALSIIDKNVMVYGEPWTAGDSPIKDSTRKPYIDKCSSSVSVNGVACFNDDIRDAMKGAEAFDFWRGHVQGLFNDGWIATGLLGSLNEDGGFTDRIGRSLNYAECHDNYTLFDKLVFSSLADIKNGAGNDFSNKFKEPTDKQLALVKKQNTLVAAYIILAQGTPFINGGQEFLRTKKGNPDSYAPDTKGGVAWSATAVDECNTIDLNRKVMYSDVYNTYKGLIALRKANPSAFGVNKNAKAETLISGVTRYTTGAFTVYFNATDKDFPLGLTQKNSMMAFIHHPTVGTADGYTKAVDVSSGAPTESALPNKVDAKSFVILKK